jgi:hypothetical protein
MLSEYWLPLVISNALALILLALSWYKPRGARYAWALLFTAASATNFVVSVSNPMAYVTGYAPLALFGFLRAFIEGWFAQHVQWTVMAIALVQFLISAGFIWGGWARRVAAGVAIAFLLGISMLGLGSGLPAPLIMAAGIALMTYKLGKKQIWVG